MVLWCCHTKHSISWSQIMVAKFPNFPSRCNPNYCWIRTCGHPIHNDNRVRAFVRSLQRDGVWWTGRAVESIDLMGAHYHIDGCASVRMPMRVCTHALTYGQWKHMPHWQLLWPRARSLACCTCCSACIGVLATMAASINTHTWRANIYNSTSTSTSQAQVAIRTTLIMFNSASHCYGPEINGQSFVTLFLCGCCSG